MIRTLESVRKNNFKMGAMICDPIATIAHRIINCSLNNIEVILSFKPQGIMLGKEIIPFSQKLSIDLFRKTSISEILFHKKINNPENAIKNIVEFLRTGRYAIINHITKDVRIVPPDQPIIDLPVVLSPEESIPGQFKHYTNSEGYPLILSAGRIEAKSFMEREPRLCFTTVSASEDDIWKRFFIKDKLSANRSRGSYVFGFDFIGESPNMETHHTPQELWIRGNIVFGQNATLRFAGLNPFGLSSWMD